MSNQMSQGASGGVDKPSNPAGPGPGDEDVPELGKPANDEIEDISVGGPDRMGSAEASNDQGVQIDLGATAARQVGRAAARLGANEAIMRGADFSRVISSISDEAVRNIALQASTVNLISSAMRANQAQIDEIARTFAKSALFTSRILRDSLSVDSLYPILQLSKAAASHKSSTAPRASRSPEDFFGTHAVDVHDVKTLLKALYVLQSKQHDHRLVWRGQQDASWAVHSSLHRRLESSGAVDEDRLVAAEVEELNAASMWGRDVSRPLQFFADLQHHGAPTRLIDVSTDPEIACWFAVEAHPDLDAMDSLVLAWGRAPRVGRTVPDPPAEVSADIGEVPFWHSWEDAEHRRPADWGTGTRTWTWFPPALSDRMRAQRAGFLLEAGPILTSGVVRVFADELSLDWRSSEIARATSIVGLPSRHDVRTKPNVARLVPIFALRISANAKEEIRGYLEVKGLRYSSVYPDLGGLVQHLKGPHGPR